MVNREVEWAGSYIEWSSKENTSLGILFGWLCGKADISFPEQKEAKCEMRRGPIPHTPKNTDIGWI